MPFHRKRGRGKGREREREGEKVSEREHESLCWKARCGQGVYSNECVAVFHLNLNEQRCIVF